MRRLGSNNTAELTAIGEALLWCLQYFRNAQNIAAVANQRVVIRYDSEYAANSVQGIFNGKKNTELIGEVRKYYSALQRVTMSGRALEVEFVYVKGHSSSRWNKQSDKLASIGASGNVCSAGRYGQHNISAPLAEIEEKEATRQPDASQISSSLQETNSIINFHRKDVKRNFCDLTSANHDEVSSSNLSNCSELTEMPYQRQRLNDNIEVVSLSSDDSDF